MIGGGHLAIGVGDQPYICHVPARHRKDRGDIAVKPESAQLCPEAIMPGPCRRGISPSLRSHQQCAATEFTMTTWPGRPYPRIGSHQHGRGFSGSRAGGPDREEHLWIDAAARGALTPVHVFTIRSAAPDRARMSRWPAPWPAVRRACRATGDKCAIEDQSTRVGRRMEGVRRPPDQTCDRCGPAVRAAYGVRRDGEFYLCRTARTGSGLARRQGRASAATS